MWCMSACVYCMREAERCVCENIMTKPSSKVRGSIESEYMFVIYGNSVNNRTATKDSFYY